MTLELAPIDRALHDGDFGAASATAMRLLVRYGNAIGADKFVSIECAHIDGCLYHGPSSIDFARRFVDAGGHVRVPTTLNVAAVDTVHPGWHRGDPGLIEEQLELTALHEALGCLATLTCAPYQRMLRPRLGEHVAWGESNAIVFANSVLGARTDRYGDFTDLCGALTGRVPHAGLHRYENRRATVRIDVGRVDHIGIARDLYFSCVGYALGKAVGAQVAIIVGLPEDTTEDEFKALGSAAASSGAVALFHAVGLTPEAPSIAAATQGHDVLHQIDIKDEALSAALADLCPLVLGESVGAMCVGTPHFSLEEFHRLAELVAGRTAAATVEVYVSTSREIAAQVAELPIAQALESFGAKVVVDTCTYLAPVVRNGHAAIVTNSAKWAHYGPGNLGRRAGLLALDRCVNSAVAGVVAR